MTDSKRKDLGWWINMAMYTFFVLGGQSAGTLLGRLYFAKGGKSKWLSTVLQLIGFPAFIPLYHILPGLSSQGSNYHYRRNKPIPMNLAIVYITLGLLVAANSILYSIGLQDLPVSTYSLICASQLAFNAIFAFFLNSQKFTPYILNSIVLLTVTSKLLIFQNNSSDSSGVSKGKYAIGFVCTVVASAGFSLMLSLTQFAFERVLKTQSFVAILDVCIYQQLIATCFTIIGLFSSGQWQTLKSEMDGFESGKVSYLMTIIWIALTWGAFTIGALGLIVQVFSLFSNVISTLGLLLIPVLAVIFFHEKMDGIMVMAMLLAIWGFISYMYQHYLDCNKNKDQNPKVSENQA
ncbi:hypothetical protein Drorol1_Dr00020792 [Drosera rotundifolia]